MEDNMDGQLGANAPAYFQMGQQSGNRFSGIGGAIDVILAVAMQNKQQAIQQNQFGRQMAGTIYGAQLGAGMTGDQGLLGQAMPGYTPTAGAGTSQYGPAKQLEMAKTMSGMQHEGLTSQKLWAEQQPLLSRMGMFFGGVPQTGGMPQQFGQSQGVMMQDAQGNKALVDPSTGKVLKEL